MSIPSDHDGDTVRTAGPDHGPGRPDDSPTVPVATGDPVPDGDDRTRSLPTGLRHARFSWGRVLSYAILAVMAAGDGVGIYLTLVAVFEGQSDITRVFTVALTLGAVVGAHEIGRLTRSRRDGRGGHPVWITALAVAWGTVGGGIAWLRISNPLNDDATAAVQVGILLLGLYLLTGGVAMTVAYRHGSPVEAELSDLIRRRDRTAREIDEYRFDQERVAGLTAHSAEERRLLEERFAGRDFNEAYGEFMKSHSAYRQAGHRGDPRDTDELIEPGHPLPPDGSRTGP